MHKGQCDVTFLRWRGATGMPLQPRTGRTLLVCSPVADLPLRRSSMKFNQGSSTDAWSSGTNLLNSPGFFTVMFLWASRMNCKLVRCSTVSKSFSSHVNRLKCATDGARTCQVHFQTAQELAAAISLKMGKLNLHRKEGLDYRTRNFYVFTLNCFLCLTEGRAGFPRTIMTASAHMWVRLLHHHGNHRERSVMSREERLVSWWSHPAD